MSFYGFIRLACQQNVCSCRHPPILFFFLKHPPFLPLTESRCTREKWHGFANHGASRHTCAWVMSHESWVMSHESWVMSHISRIDESCTRERRHESANRGASRHTHEWVMSHESCHTYERIMYKREMKWISQAQPLQTEEATRCIHGRRRTALSSNEYDIMSHEICIWFIRCIHIQCPCLIVRLDRGGETPNSYTEFVTYLH